MQGHNASLRAIPDRARHAGSRLSNRGGRKRRRSASRSGISSFSSVTRMYWLSRSCCTPRFTVSTSRPTRVESSIGEMLKKAGKPVGIGTSRALLRELEQRADDLRLGVAEHHDFDLILGVAQPAHELLHHARGDRRVVLEEVLQRRLIERQREPGGESAMAVDDRRAPVSRALSPKRSPGLRTIKLRSTPRTFLISRTRPSSKRYASVPASPSRKMTSPASETAAEARVESRSASAVRLVTAIGQRGHGSIPTFLPRRGGISEHRDRARSEETAQKQGLRAPAPRSQRTASLAGRGRPLHQPRGAMLGMIWASGARTYKGSSAAGSPKDGSRSASRAIHAASGLSSSSPHTMRSPRGAIP